MSLLSRIRSLENCASMLKFWQNSQTLSVTKRPLFETMTIWAEESGGADPNSAEWSFGNGATGFIGLPLDEGWELVSLGYHADTYPATASVSVALCDYTTPSSAATNIVATIDLANAADGGGGTNNAFKVLVLPVPIPIAGRPVIGFRTLTGVGSISDHRISARLRRKVGDYVSEVTLS